VFGLGVVRTLRLADALGRRQHLAFALVGELELVDGEFDDEAVVVTGVKREEDTAVEDVVRVAVVLEGVRDVAEPVGFDGKAEVVDAADPRPLWLILPAVRTYR